ncbi:MAG TPA: CPBP family glutamic-type intramembrane protease, partial [Bellilinea sp.]|nr:CPBP family glutamic-type intramembrane protease [Bellilinea sp.]
IFMLAHGIVFLNAPQYPAFLVIFIGGIVFGLLVCYSRSITASMIAHAFYNGFGLFTAYILNWLF